MAHKPPLALSLSEICVLGWGASLVSYHSKSLYLRARLGFSAYSEAGVRKRSRVEHMVIASLLPSI